ncbi:hypothetical protein SMICM17S_12387 [Streptomyces microflavus]
MIRSPSFLPKTGFSPSVAPANSQGPLRFFHCSRTCWGRGYSGSGLFLSSLSPQVVVRRCVERFLAVRPISGTASVPDFSPLFPSWTTLTRWSLRTGAARSMIRARGLSEARVTDFTGIGEVSTSILRWSFTLP